MDDNGILIELAKFFVDELKRDRAGTEDWVAQGDYEVDAFIARVQKLAGPDADRA